MTGLAAAARVIACAPLTVAALGCLTHAEVRTSPGASAAETPRIVVMPLDVELYVLQASGLPEPKADWTQQARAHLDRAIREHLTRLGTEFVTYAPPEADAEAAHTDTQLLKLHEVVARSIYANSYVRAESMALPTKRRGFHWSLGPEVRSLGARYDADYALFTFLRDSSAGASRKAFMVGASILSGLNYIPLGGVQAGYASLVDLDTGRVVWFAALDRGAGDVRQLEPARETVEALLAGLPQ